MMDSVYPAKTLRDFKPKHKFFIGIDSDGCAFDSMGIKQRECFCPWMIGYFGLQPIAEAARQCKDFADLFSKTRGANRLVADSYPYLYLDGLYLKRSWGGEVHNIAILVAVGVDKDSFRDIVGVSEGIKEDKESWRSFLRHLKQRGLNSTHLVISDKCLGLVEVLGEFFPDAKWQWCMVLTIHGCAWRLTRGHCMLESHFSSLIAADVVY